MHRDAGEPRLHGDRARAGRPTPDHPAENDPEAPDDAEVGVVRSAEPLSRLSVRSPRATSQPLSRVEAGRPRQEGTGRPMQILDEGTSALSAEPRYGDPVPAGASRSGTRPAPGTPAVAIPPRFAAEGAAPLPQPWPELTHVLPPPAEAPPASLVVRELARVRRLTEEQGAV
jgi:hypothetical protein